MRLRDLIEELIEVQRAMGSAAEAVRTDPSQRANLIEARRQFANLVRTVNDAIDQDSQLAADLELQREFRRRFSEMRNRIAVHQAKWPAVLLDNADPAFSMSANDIIRNNRAFAAWALETLKR